MNRETTIIGQALAKSVIENVPREAWSDAGREAVALYRQICDDVSGADTGGGGGHAPAVQQAAPSGATKRPPAAAAAPDASRYTIKARSGKSTDANARLCLQDTGGAEQWVGFRGADARVAMQLQNGDDVTCQIERRGEWLNGSNLKRHIADIPF